MSQNGAAGLRERFVRELAAGGFLHSPSLAAAFGDVPRDEFLPRFFRPTEAGRWEAIDGRHPQWLELVYTNVTWVTQLDGDDSRWQAALSGPVLGEPTSSSTLPGLMAQMLEA